MTYLTIFTQHIRVENELYSLNDLHLASGKAKKHQPSDFLKNEKTKEIIEEIERSEDFRIAVQKKRGGHNQGTWVCKELVYSYAMWISAKFHLQVIRAFDAMSNAPTALPSYSGLNLNEDQARFFRAMLRMSHKLEKRELNTINKVRSVKSQLAVLQEQCALLEAQAKELESDMSFDLDVLRHLHLYRGLMIDKKYGRQLQSYLDN